MNFKFLLNPNDPIIDELAKIGITNDNSSDYIIMKNNMTLNYLSVKKDDQSFFINVEDVVYIESLGHDVIIHSNEETYITKERLKQLERLLNPDVFLRVSNSSIISIKHLKKIEASLLQKFILHMSNGDKVDVTRSYYQIFRNKLHI